MHTQSKLSVYSQSSFFDRVRTESERKHQHNTIQHAGDCSVIPTVPIHRPTIDYKGRSTDSWRSGFLCTLNTTHGGSSSNQ